MRKGGSSLGRWSGGKGILCEGREGQSLVGASEHGPLGKGKSQEGVRSRCLSTYHEVNIGHGLRKAAAPINGAAAVAAGELCISSM